MTPPLLFRRKPLMIEALYYDGTNGAEVAAWCRGTFWDGPCETQHVEIRNPNGDTLMAVPDDYVVHGPHDEFWPVPSARFAATYDPIIRNH